MAIDSASNTGARSPHPPLTRRALAACLNRLKAWNVSNEDTIRDREFQFYHLHRNYFNNKYSRNETEGGTIMTLRQSGLSSTFVDNLGRQWTEVSWFGIAYHQDAEERRDDFWKRHRNWRTRKFYSPDEHMTAAGFSGCEFELIIRDGQRLISGIHMETYNFGPYGLLSTAGPNGLHGKFDVKPHEANGNYETKYYPASSIRIIDNSVMDFMPFQHR